MRSLHGVTMLELLQKQITVLIKGLINHFALAGEVKTSVVPHYFASGQDITSQKELLGINKNRIGFIIHNKSGNSIYIAFNGEPASQRNFTDEMGAHSRWEYQPTTGCYKGAVTWNPSVSGDGLVSVTEITLEPARRLEK